MQQHLQRLDGVAKAEVSLRDGHVTVLPKENGVLDPQKILKATYDSGVSVAEMGITAEGAVAQSGGRLVFRISEQQSYELAPSSAAERLRPRRSPDGASLRVRGRLYQKPPEAAKQKDPPALTRVEILEVLGGVQ